MKKLKLFITSLVAALSIAPFVAPALYHASAADASIGENINCGASGSLDGTGCGNVSEGADQVSKTIKSVIQLFQVIVGLISVFMIIYGGLKYITSGGNDNAIKGARNTILYAVIGLVIVVIAQAIVSFVLNRFDG